MSGFVHDVRHALRLLARNRGLTIVAILTLGLGIGLLTTVFAVVDGLLYRALPYAEAKRLVSLAEPPTARVYGFNQMPAARVTLLRRATKSYEDIAAFEERAANVAAGGSLEVVGIGEVTPNAFALLRAAPLLGRSFTEEDARADAHVVVLSHGLWATRFGADPAALGASVRIDGEPYAIVGVMPPEFGFYERARLWTPLDLASAARADDVVSVFARLAAGATVASARAELATINAGLPPQGRGALQLTPSLVDRGNAGAIGMLVVGAVLIIVLIACTNLGGLLLARGATRRSEMAVRAVLGAGRRRIVRQNVTESLVLALIGAAAGVLFAVWSTPLLRRIAPNVPAWVSFAVDTRVVAFAIAGGLVTLLVFGLLPALEAGRIDLHAPLRGGTAGGGPRRRRFIAALTVIEIACSFVLLVCAVLVARSASALERLDPAVDAEGVLVVDFALDRARYAYAAAETRFHDELASTLSSSARVVAASFDGYYGGSATDTVAAGSVGGFERGLRLEEDPDVVAPGRFPDLRVVGDDFARVLGMSVRAGRALGPAEAAAAPPGGVVSDGLAARLWPDGRVLGRRFRLNATGPWITVVGVVDEAMRAGVGGAGISVRSAETIYLSARQFAASAPRLLVRGLGDPRDLLPEVRRVAAAIDPDQAIRSAVPLAEELEQSHLPVRWAALTFAAFAAFALVLAMMGIYGVVSYAVTQHAHEIGVRIALGAEPRAVLRLFLVRGLRLAAAGVLGGAMLTVAAARSLRALLYGVESTDPLTFFAVAVLFCAVTLAASAVPARRALRLDPLAALRL
jgi:putative ABC transport system permease protein